MKYFLFYPIRMKFLINDKECGGKFKRERGKRERNIPFTEYLG